MTMTMIVMIMIMLMMAIMIFHLSIIILKSRNGVVHFVPVHQGGSPISAVIGRKLVMIIMVIVIVEIRNDDYDIRIWWWLLRKWWWGDEACSAIQTGFGMWGGGWGGDILALMWKDIVCLLPSVANDYDGNEDDDEEEMSCLTLALMWKDTARVAICVNSGYDEEQDDDDDIECDGEKTSSATQSGFDVKRHWPGCQSVWLGEIYQVSRPHLVSMIISSWSGWLSSWSGWFSHVSVLLSFPSDCNHQESIRCHNLGGVVDHLEESLVLEANWHWQLAKRHRLSVDCLLPFDLCAQNPPKSVVVLLVISKAHRSLSFHH